MVSICFPQDSTFQALQAQLRGIMADFATEEVPIDFGHSMTVSMTQCIRSVRGIYLAFSGSALRYVAQEQAAEAAILLQKWQRNYGDEMKQRKARLKTGTEWCGMAQNGEEYLQIGAEARCQPPGYNIHHTSSYSWRQSLWTQPCNPN